MGGRVDGLVGEEGRGEGLNGESCQGKAIRGWEECVRKMSLGEKLELTVFPKWAYRKAGLQDPDTGKYIVPPNSTLKFEMRLVQVRDKTVPTE